MSTTAESASPRAPEVFSARVAIILFLVGVFSFSAFVTLSTFAPELTEGDARAHALSRSAVGYAGIIKLARANGAIVNVSRTEPLVSAPLVVLTPDEKVSFEQIDRLSNVTALIVLPKWSVFPSLKHSGWVQEIGPMSEDWIGGLLDDIAPKARVKQAKSSSAPVLKWEPIESKDLNRGGDLRPGTISSLQTIAAPAIKPVATTVDGKTVLGVIHREDSPDIYILSDPDLLNTQGIADIATARSALALLDALRAPGEPIAFDVTMNGYARARSLMRLAFEPPLLAATLSFVLVAALIAWRAATRDGPSKTRGRVFAYGKRTLADNSAALIRLAGREHTMAGRYADLVRTVVAERIGVTREGAQATSAELDRIAKTRGIAASFSSLAAEASSAQTGIDGVTAARKLHTWTEEMIRATR